MFLSTNFYTSIFLKKDFFMYIYTFHIGSLPVWSHDLPPFFYSFFLQFSRTTNSFLVRDINRVNKVELPIPSSLEI